MAMLQRVVARHFSASSSANQLVKAPTQVFGIEGRYATALYSAASKEKQLETVEKDMKEIKNLIKKKGKFADFLRDPSMSRAQKKELMTSAVGSSKASKLTGNLVGLLAENGRLNKLENISNAFASLMSAHRGEVVCEVTTAKELDAELQQELDTALKAFLKAGQTIHVTRKVDPTILGGLIVSIGDKYVDMSTASKIKKYSDIIQAAV